MGMGIGKGILFLFLAYSWMGGGHLLLCMDGWTMDMASWMIVTINTSSQFLIFLSFHCVWFCFVVHGDDIWVAMRTSAFGFGMAFLDIIGGQSGLEDFLCASWLWIPLEFIFSLYILLYQRWLLFYRQYSIVYFLSISSYELWMLDVARSSCLLSVTGSEVAFERCVHHACMFY